MSTPRKTKKKRSRLRLFDLNDSARTPFKEINTQNLSGFSPLYSSTPKPVLITPKVQKTNDDGYSSFQSPTTFSVCSSLTNFEHSYCKLLVHESVESPKKKHAKKLSKVPAVLEEVVINSVTRDDDIMTAAECALIQSVLPLQSRQEFAKSILDIPSLKRAVKNILLGELSNDNAVLRARKRGKISQLMKKDFNDLKNFCWEDIIREMTEEFPFLAEVILAMIIPNNASEAKRNERLASVLPRIGLVYAVLAQTRNPELSKVQRCLSMLLFDSLCDQRVFDRLHPLGLCLSYGHSLSVMDSFGGSFNTAVVDAIQQGKRIRIVGDNVNWKTGVHDERRDRHEHMNHAFGSAVIIQNNSFSHLRDIAPQNPYTQLKVEDFLLSAGDWEEMRLEYATLISRVVGRHIPSLAFVKDYFQKLIKGPYSEQLCLPNKVVPLPVLHLNEQKYDDVVKIMDYYEKFIEDTHRNAGFPKKEVHIGGDQLTRERFSGAKRLRAGGITREQRFDHLTPITFEFFHMLMNYVSLIFKQLYKNDSETDVGTMKCEQNRILRTKVNENVNEYYDADKDFITSFVDAYVVEAVLDYFGMENINAVPTQNIPPPFSCTAEAAEWATTHFTTIVDRYVGQTLVTTQTNTVEEDGMVMSVKLANGASKTIILRKLKRITKDDHVKNYSHLVLEVGLLFKSLLDLCKTPNRDRGMRLLKVAMVHFKANNSLSKYAYEIMRFLVHQKSVLSEKAAHEEFYGLFVNTRGGLDGHIPCDLQMEFLVKQIKRNIKHMFSNKTEKNITVRTSALPALNDIAENFDSISNVIVRAKKHSDADAKKDELDMISDLRLLKPFKCVPGRSHQAFPKVSKSISSQLNINLFHSWVSEQKVKFATEIGI